MVFLAPLLVLLGALLAHRARVLILLPATLLVWVIAVQLARIESFSLWQIVLVAFMGGACLQLGYLGGAVFFHQRLAAQRKRAIVVVRR